MMNNNLLMSMMLFFSLIHLPIFLMVILYKIKIFRGKNSKQRLIFEFFLMALIYFLNSTLLPLYLVIYMASELIYHISSRITRLKVLDRVLISSAIGALVVYYFYNIYSADIYEGLSRAWEISQGQSGKFYEKALKLNGEESQKFMSAMTSSFNATLEYMKENFIFISFLSLFIVNYMINFMYRKYSSSNWEMSYLGLLVYIIPVIMIKISGEGSFLLKNLTAIGQFIYIIYGIKTVYKLISKKLNTKIYTKMLSVVAAIIFPQILFLIGAFKSFDIKIKIVRK